MSSLILEQSQAKTVIIGGFWDETLDIPAVQTMQVNLYKNGVSGGAVAGIVHLGDGFFSVPLSSAHTNTRGVLSLRCFQTTGQARGQVFNFLVVHTDSYAMLVQGTPLPGGGGVSADAVADAVWDSLITSHTLVNSFGLVLQGKAAPGDQMDITTGALNLIADGVWEWPLASVTNPAGMGTRFLTRLDANTSTRAAPGDTMGLSAAAVNSIWDEATSEGRTAGSYGQRIKDNLDVPVSSVGSGLTAQQVWEYGGGRSVTDKTGFSLSTAAIDAIWEYNTALITDASGIGIQIKTNLNTTVSSRAAPGNSMSLTAGAVDDIWNEVQSGHTTPGTFGKYLDTEVSGVAPGSFPTADQIADQVWNEPASEHQNSGSFGRAIGNPGVSTVTIWDRVSANLDATISSRSTHTAANVWQQASRTITGGTITTNLDKSGYRITGTKQTLDSLNDITANSVWSVVPRSLTSYAGVGSEVWDQLLTGITVSGSIGKLLKDNVDAAITTRSSHTAAGVWASPTRTTTGGTINTVTGTVASNLTQILAANISEASAGRIAGNWQSFWANADLATGKVVDDVGGAGVGGTSRARAYAPTRHEIPGTGSDTIRVFFFTYNSGGAAADLDALATVTAENQAGVSRSANLSVVTDAGTGEYYVDYTVASTHAEEDIIFRWSGTMGADTLKGLAQTSMIVDAVVTDWSAAERQQIRQALGVTGTATATTGAGDIHAIKTDVWTRLTSGFTTAGTVGKLLADNVDATIASRSSHSAADVWTAGTRTITGGTITTVSDKVGYSISGTKTTLDSLNDITASSVLVGSPLAELAQGVPPASPTVEQAIMLLYMGMRNEMQTTTAEKRVKNSSGVIVAKASLTDDGTTFTKAAMVGP
jgi:hypothetical protein